MAYYLLGLMLVPCAEIHAENDLSESTIETFDIHENHVDMCSPFCFCECCQTVSQPARINYLVFFSTLIRISSPNIQTSEFSIPITLWHPPRI